MPTVSVIAPNAGAIVGGSSITVSASAWSSVGVVGVQFKLDGANLGVEQLTWPYSITWDTTQVPNGNHTLSAVARDTAGNQATSPAITFAVNNSSTSSDPHTVHPSVLKMASSANVTVSGSSVGVLASVSDDVAVAGVQFKLDGTNLGAEKTTAPYAPPGIQRR